MGVLVFVCRRQATKWSQGSKSTLSYQGLKNETAEIKCSVCGLSHNFFQIETRLVDDNLPIGD